MNYQHDIFISYPSTLNKTPYAFWVTTFEQKLRDALEDLLPNLPNPKIYLDEWEIKANSVHAEMLERARSSRVFLAIVSPSYQDRAWAPLELEAFASDLLDPHRLFVIASKPLPENEIRLDALKGRPIKRFYVNAADKRRALPFDPTGTEFQKAVYDLAVAMAEKLDQMLAAGDEKSHAIPKTRRRTILLAQVTDDLDAALRQVADELQQQCLEHDVMLLPGTDYPLGGDAFRKAFAEDLSRADLVVQLLGKTLGKRPRDLPEGFVLAQAQAAQDHPGATLIQWRRAGVDVAQYDDPELRDLLQGETVMASTLSAFRDALIAWIRTPPKDDTQDVSDVLCGTQIFINAEKADLPAALLCRDAVRDLCPSAWVPPQGDPEKASIQQELSSLITDSDSLLFINGQADSAWVANQMRLAWKSRASKRRTIAGAVCNGPPIGKPELHGYVKGIVPIECTAPDGVSWDFEPVLAYLKKNAGEAR